ncbi:MAG: ATP-binding protein, partial [Acidimicrobiales bacterium]
TETILINLLRGSATDGLAGMRPGVRHPLLSIRRSETRQVCMAAGLSWFEDPSNRDGRHLRNRVRHELLPWLSEAASRDMVPLLCRQAGLLAADAALLDELSASLDVTDARALASSPAPLARRAVRRWLRAELGGYPPSAAAVERVLTVAAGRVVGSEVSRGLSVRRSGGRLRLEHGRPGGKERTPTVN